jgi:energy-coupling factor transporter transmembrane protein EcfT
MRAGLLHFFFPDSLFANMIWFSSNVAIIVLSTIRMSYIMAAIWTVVIYVAMSVIYFLQATSWKKTERVWLVLKILSMLVIVGGFVIQYTLEDTCGVDGLQSCFAGCPLADPTAFNNTAIKNVLVAVGVVFLAIAEIFLPVHEFWDTYDDEESVFSTGKRNVVYNPRDQESGSSIGHGDDNPSAAGSLDSSQYIEEY